MTRVVRHLLQAGRSVHVVWTSCVEVGEGVEGLLEPAPLIDARLARRALEEPTPSARVPLRSPVSVGRLDVRLARPWRAPTTETVALEGQVAGLLLGWRQVDGGTGRRQFPLLFLSRLPLMVSHSAQSLRGLSVTVTTPGVARESKPFGPSSTSFVQGLV